MTCAPIRPVALGATLLALAIGGCSDPVERTATNAAQQSKTAVESDRGGQPATRVKRPAPPQKPQNQHELCQDCHPDEVAGFLATGMGRSFYRPSGAPIIENFAPEVATLKHKRMAATYRAYIDKQGVWWQEETVPGTDYSRRVKVEYIIGSGNHSRSYLGLVNGELIQLPLTWYSQKGLWDMSPGYEGRGHLRFLRAVVPECLFCHNGLSPHRVETIARYDHPLKLGIDCARCHGDGSLHAAKRAAGATPPDGAPDPWIMNPAHLSETRAMEVCQQCHLQGTVRLLQAGRRWDQYSPKEPLSDLLTVYGFPQTGGRFEIASHSERLSKSKCRTQAKEQLRCSTCHNPHAKSTTQVPVVCANCHQDKPCLDPIGKEPGVDCVECHMRKGGVSDVPHVTFTDHRISRRATPSRLGHEATQAQRLKRVLKELSTPKPGDSRTALRLAHADVLHSLIGAGDRLRLPAAYERLSHVVKSHPDAMEAYEALGKAALELRQPKQALEAFQHLQAKAPKRLTFRVPFGQLLLDLGRPKAALEVLRPLVTAIPEHGLAWGLMGVGHSTLGDFLEANRALQRAAQLMPDDSTVQFSLGMTALNQGQPKSAFTFWSRAVALDPLNVQAGVERARYLRFNGKPQRAKAALESLLKIQRDGPQVNLELARIAAAEGRTEDALRYYSHESRYYPKLPDAYIERAQLSMRIDDRNEARSAIQSGRLAIPEFPHWDRIEADLLGPKAPPSPAPATK